MTPQSLDLIDKLFGRDWRGRRDDAEVTIRGYVTRAETMNDLERIRMHDSNAARLIQECNDLAAQLAAYRLSLAERYNALVTSPTVPVVKLVREPNYYDKKVYYYLRTYRRYINDGTDVEETSTRYAGSDRKKAFAGFDAYCKAHPGIIAEKQIERRGWEK